MRDNPLVSILIPTFNRPMLLEKSLRSAVNQTYKNIEIVICDDSTNYDSKTVVESYMKRYKNIRYYFNNGPLGNFGLNNVKKCYELSKGEYINYLNDDDMFHKSKIMRMIRYFQNYKKITLVTSHRSVIDKNDNILPDINATKRIRYLNRPVSGRIIAKLMFNLGNFIGEPTTVLFKKSDVKNFGSLNGKQYYSLIDAATWFELLSKGYCVYIADTLSYFRIHEGQNTNRPEVSGRFLLEWKDLNDYGYRKKIIDSEFYKRFLLSFKKEYEKPK
ncbi:glycosyltransferase involved in cell wall biosynthesis [Clostridium acetobutylicum]|uniref:Glycosyltransferase n=1 Tax=Clostridium acetobutylicum (strain ATCC 824 / DSM 792 / JCM 1419 / IAM 19013 / LMG 5710 / NBRC 13948 / NRRL B-527 / VKM B-1787 / 2291 / W) TaxID=272562 RepID=Q97GM0_CLOAB|nr:MULTISPECIES: glycosyltransferase family 2 protein [Clostridium]AAK80302.1 Glycosyltransferase [Clostridium acetobutylicum ATCC 824]ADZ21397.1 Glycosyltransferase [Clostridium acetobutylicum EA 2018]AEI34538.1 glycosyltransferase [Clostridium acetobutylicum DSM 1731]AWV79277.1 glycosyltransferase family 2 protein [Clostridium acetobutylicum]MBC2394754.1 glycosyltransferase family 2 protein [Clostridium acetobutylicum]